MSRKTKNPIDRAALMQISGGTLAQITTKTNFLAKLTDIVRQICADIPEQAYQIANFHGDAIIIEVKSSVWGQRLQFERTNIAQALAKATQGQYTKIDIKVNPYFARSNQSIENELPHRYHTISEQTAKKLTEVALKAPKGLKEKLERLARLAKKSG
jgi:hypothetical protein